ncbi:unnamed protein product [Cuscuta campestris]|uniref:Reverse transcriptase RNase H-like domain-containing protein n=1 Tax=Cuscuta campestris TaxID=132261 RepID=A0A484M546_9ASTE|nr:unnamed protein product [Cuscuta campestris]
MGGSGPGTGFTYALGGPNTEHAATSQHKGKKTRRSRRRPGKAKMIEEVLVEDIPEGEDDESSECRVSTFKHLGAMRLMCRLSTSSTRDKRVVRATFANRFSEGKRRHAEESATSDARSVGRERTNGRNLVSSVLVKEEGGAQHLVYYTAKTLRQPEFRYSIVEETVLAVVSTAQRLTPYYQAHPVQMVFGHVSTEFEAKDERKKKYRDAAVELLKGFTAYNVERIPCAENVKVDILSKLSFETPEHIWRMANVEELTKPSIHTFIVEKICAQPRDWTDDIVVCVKDGVLPDDATKATLVWSRAAGYTLEDGKLYKRAYNGTLLRCQSETSQGGGTC